MQNGKVVLDDGTHTGQYGPPNLYVELSPPATYQYAFPEATVDIVYDLVAEAWYGSFASDTVYLTAAIGVAKTDHWSLILQRYDLTTDPVTVGPMMFYHKYFGLTADGVYVPFDAAPPGDQIVTMAP